MNKIFILFLALFASLFISKTSVDAAPLLSSPYVVPTDSNGEPRKEVPLNLVNLKYVGDNLNNDVFVNDKLVSKLVFSVNKGSSIIIKNMGKYKKETIDLNIISIDDASISILNNGTITIRPVNASPKGIISINVYKHDTKIIYPNLYVGYADKISNGWDGYAVSDQFGYENLYGLYLPKDLGTILGSVDLVEHDKLLDLRYGKGDVNNPEIVYPIFKNTETGFIRGQSNGNMNSVIKLFDPSHPSPIPSPYEGVNALKNEQEAANLTSLDVHYIVTQKLSNYVTPSHYPSDQSFKIKTSFELDPSEGFPIEAVVKLENNQVVDKKYYSSVSLKNSHEVTFSTDFLQKYKGTTIKIDYKQSLNKQEDRLMHYYNRDEKAFILPYTSENKWERRGIYFKQEEPSTGETKVNFPTKLGATILNGKKVIQNKSTDDYGPLDFISELTSNFPEDSVSATFTKKVIFQNVGEQDIYITLKSALSSVTQDIVVKVVVIKGTLHFTEIPSGLTFPTIALTGKMTDYEVSSFNKGSLAVLDERLTSSPWSLTATLTENKGPNNFGDILYFRNEEGTVYNITNQTQNVMTNRNLEPSKTIIDYEKNKQIGLFIRVNPIFTKKGAYEGSVTWSLVDAPS